MLIFAIFLVLIALTAFITCSIVCGAAITAEAAIAQAKGEAEALEITRQALQNMPDTWVQQLWIEKWDGKLPTTQAGSDAAIIVNPNMGN